MITQIDLRHFKCFQTLKLSLGPLTLLSGANASGKSSVLHALALLHQTMREHEWSSRLMLNGAAIHIGCAADVIDQVYGRRGFSISLCDDDEDWFHWNFEANPSEMSMALRRAWGRTKASGGWDVDGDQPLHHLVPMEHEQHPLTERLRRLTYLTAERQGPREYYLYGDPQLTPVVGPRGEHAASLLLSGRDEDVLSHLVIETARASRFHQVEACMARLFPGCVLEITQVPRANAVTLGIRVSRDTDFLRPLHAGFGLTQVLPIVVAAFSASHDDLLLIENPEVHLHPAGQANIGALLAEVASAGVQVIIETHSDHVLNGIRRAVKNHVVASNQVELHFFRRRRPENVEAPPQVESPKLDQDGNIDSWPDGFFDQFDRDMNYFAGWT